ncbi:phosphotransferase [Dictyobacter formicarum]|uniref:Aminoglycoside phosphotransferase n=1 Tax=Dictyobacter formicarum TaxID=2778368 RepID=A0ABQ3VJ40_9CHLR|nr:phosphotransferase [Dictyobacter formicarum]GHO85800.1 aminoglycoside phosphotransferase [Dictyobacter formicarum]
MLPSMNLSYAIQNMLEGTFHLSDWSISRTVEGQQKECYVAKTETRTVFIKFDGSTPIAVLQRLGELGVAPRLLGTGNIEGRRYVLQDYLTGQHPGWRWFADHLPLLAQVTHRYHTDNKLKQLLTSSATREYHEQIASELAELEIRMLSLQVDTELKVMLRDVFDDLKSQARRLHAVPLAPVHDDPNGANMFLINENVMLVDWDDMLLSDPMRDVSQWLGWYVPQERWQLFFKEYDLLLDQALLNRIYWWSARASFANVLWHIEHSYDYDVFLRDSIAALRQEIRPHQVFKEDV